MTELKPLTTFKYITDILKKLVEKKHWSAEDAMKFLNEIPTADVVEVVRCKDCKYWDTRDSKGIQGICLCGEKDFYYGSEFYPFADDYCSYGERREG